MSAAAEGSQSGEQAKSLIGSVVKDSGELLDTLDDIPRDAAGDVLEGIANASENFGAAARKLASIIRS